MKHVSVIMLAGVLAGCATQALQQYQQVQANMAAAVKVAGDCVADLKNTPAYQRLNSDFILEPNDPDTARKLTIKKRASAEQVADLVEESRGLKVCQAKTLEEISKVHPSFVIIFTKMYAETDQEIANVMDKKVTIGEANKRTLERMTRAQVEMQQAAQEVAAQFDRANQYEIAQRQRAGQLLANWAYQQQQLAQQQQLINALNRPAVTNCSWVGSFLNCTSF